MNQFQCSSVFEIPENSLVIDLENITFGPQKYTVQVKEIEMLYPRIIYYSILYYIYEIKLNEKEAQIETLLTQAILGSEEDGSFDDLGLGLSQQDSKVYFAKLTQILSRRRHENRMIVEEFNRIPQIDKIMLMFIKLICGDWLDFETNTFEISQKIYEKIGFKF